MEARPLQIVSIDAEGDGDSFILHDENLNSIVQQVLDKDPLTPVAIVSVVGAFRTGKSFLLNLFLRYLRSGDPADLSEAWMMAEGRSIVEGNLNIASPPPAEDEKEEVKPSGPAKGHLRRSESSFRWRGGKERETTGIWMWSQPFFRPASDGSGEVALLLMDTQGMFDHETSMTLTAQIFGLSTFVSSYQIYNVDKQIQEDNLQHLALFTEYGKMASDKQKKAGSLGTLSASASVDAADEKTHQELSQPPADEDKPKSFPENEEHAVPVTEVHQSASDASKPFQRLQFLVRDWQNFDETLDDCNSEEDKERLVRQLKREREDYVAQTVFKEKTLKDLKGTRDAILRCFEKIDCFQLPHPGRGVVNKKYDGSIEEIDPFFRFLVNILVRNVFDEELCAKTFHGRVVRGLEVFAYFEAFVNLFTKGSKGFPQPQTIYDATAETNNRTCALEALYSYRTSMNSLMGESKPYVQGPIVQSAHTGALQAALAIYDENANMGSEEGIATHRANLVKDIESELARYKEVNALKNPYRDLERFLVPIAIGTVSWILALLMDFWCTSDHCEAVEDAFERMYMFVAFGILVLAYNNPFKDATMYMMPLAVAVGAWFVTTIVNSTCSSDSCKKLTNAVSRVYVFVFFGAAVLAWRAFGGAKNLNKIAEIANIGNIAAAAQHLQQTAAKVAEPSK